MVRFGSAALAVLAAAAGVDASVSNSTLRGAPGAARRRLSWGIDRGMKTYMINETTVGLERKDYYIANGWWNGDVPGQRCPKGQTIAWEHKCHGCDLSGLVKYVWDENSTQGFTLEWRNPYAGGNDYWFTTEGDTFRANYFVPAGLMAEAYISIELGF